MEKILEALKKTLPGDHVKEVAKELERIIDEARTELENEYQEKLDEAYKDADEQIAVAEATAEAGYQQAHQIIQDLEVRLATQEEEYENKIEEQYEEAYALIETEKTKNANLEATLYEEFNGKLQKMMELIVDKVDQYLEMQNAEIYQRAHDNVINDPRVMEHRVAISRIAEALSDYISEDDLRGATNAKLEESHKAIEDLKGHVRVLEERNFRLTRSNENLNEQVRQQKNVLNENTKTERKVTEQKARTVSGRGKRALEGQEIISEYHNPDAIKKNDQQALTESAELKELLVLSGLETSDE